MTVRPTPLPLDAETKALEAPHDHKQELRAWLRLLTCTNLLEAEIRRRLREQFDTTLPRFDLLAQLLAEIGVSAPVRKKKSPGVSFSEPLERRTGGPTQGSEKRRR